MPGEDLQSWSITAANNGTADSSINWAEGQPRASVNNSARSMMAAQAKVRNLQNGSIVTGGSANVQTFTLGVGYTTYPVGLRVLLQIGASLTNTSATTLEMDGLGAKPISDTAGQVLNGGELLGTSFAEFLFVGTTWILLKGSVTAVATSGDIMTGQLEIDKAGNFSADPTAAALYVAGELPVIQFNRPGNTYVKAGINSGNQFSIGGGSWGADRLTLDSAGNMVAGGTVTGVQGILTGSAAVFGLIEAGSIRQIRYTSSGWGLNWSVGTGRLSFNSPTSELVGVDATGNMQIAGASASKPGGGAWADSSDLRIKNVLGDYNAGLSEIKSLAPVRYTFKGNDEEHVDDDKEYIGLIAQDVEDVMPEMVTRKKGHIDGKAVTDLRVLDTGALIYALVNSVQELLARIEVLEAR